MAPPAKPVDSDTYETVNPSCLAGGSGVCGECANVQERCLPSAVLVHKKSTTTVYSAVSCQQACDAAILCVGFTWQAPSSRDSEGTLLTTPGRCLLHAMRLGDLSDVAAGAVNGLPSSTWDTTSSVCSARGAVGAATRRPVGAAGIGGVVEGVCYRKRAVRDMSGAIACSDAGAPKVEDRLGLDIFEMDPALPVLGEPLVLGFGGIPTLAVTSGTVKVGGTVLGFHFDALSLDLCGKAGSPGATSVVQHVRCPLEKGVRFHGSVELILPLITLPSKAPTPVKVRMSVDNGGGASGGGLACYDSTIRVAPPSGGGSGGSGGGGGGGSGGGGGGGGVSPSPGAPVVRVRCEDLDCGTYGTCETATTIMASATCKCQILYRGRLCDECVIPGHLYPACSVPAKPVDKPVNTNLEELQIVWGITDFKVKATTATAPFGLAGDSADGSAMYDAGFDLTSEASQEFLLKVCTELSANVKMVQKGSVRCFITALKDWVMTQSRYGSVASTFPFPSEWMITFTKRFLLANPDYANYVRNIHRFWHSDAFHAETGYLQSGTHVPFTH